MSSNGQPTNYTAPEYVVPKIVENLGMILRAPRSGQSTSFADAVSPNESMQDEYARGIIVVSCIIASIAVVWFVILLILKFKGDKVGCASGQPFYQRAQEEVISFTESSSSSSLGEEYSYENSERGRGDGHHGVRSSEMPASFDDDNINNSEYNDDGWSLEESNFTAEVTEREFRTRLVFLFFCCVVLVCVPCILVFSFGPMKEALRKSDNTILEAVDVLMEIKGGITTIEEAVLDADRIVENTPKEYDELCPQVPLEEAEEVLGMDLEDLTEILSNEFIELSDDVQKDISDISFLLDRVETGIDDFDESKSEVEGYMWVVPGLLFGVSIVTAISMLSALLAWREKSGRTFQKGVSYVLLPALMLVCIACWVVVLFAAFGTMTSSDICTAGGSSGGSPDQTIQDILAIHNIDANTTAFKYVTAYTNRCLGDDPTIDVQYLENIVQNAISRIWREISTVDSIGRSNLIEKCGGTKLPELFDGARNLAKLLTAVRRSLDSTTLSLQCQRINSIYVEFAYDSVCTETASSSAYGFFLFFLLSISLTIIITLRASMLRNIPDEKVYHDEDEVAENMILDEHEEYLAYISKYKHEWQEYNGINEESLAGSRGRSFDDDQGSETYYDDEPSYIESEDMTMSEAESEEDNMATVEIFPTLLGLEDNNHKNEDQVLDDISFPSLDADDQVATSKEYLSHLPSMLVPPPERNPDFEEVSPCKEGFNINSLATKGPSDKLPYELSRHSSRSQRSGMTSSKKGDDVILDIMVNRRPTVDEGNIEVQLSSRPANTPANEGKKSYGKSARKNSSKAKAPGQSPGLPAPSSVRSSRQPDAPSTPVDRSSGHDSSSNRRSHSTHSSFAEF